MKIVFDIEQQRDMTPKAATVGFFDGVHTGHRFLIGELRRIAAEKGLPSAIVTFDRHPRITLQSGYCPLLITDKGEKIKEFDRLGVDYCYFLHFTEEMATLSAEEFIRDILKKKIGVSVLLVGYDHRFGKDRREGFDEYIRYGRENGIEVILVPSLSEKGEAPSSSTIREVLLAGNMEAAAKLLGRPYEITGSVAAGFAIGRKIGFPTANLQLDEPEKIIPPDGVYAVRIFVEGSGNPYGGMLYIGTRPTLDNGQEKSIEVNIFDFNEDVYNRKLTVEFHKYIRSSMRFDSLTALRRQLEADKKAVLSVLPEEGR